MRVDNRWKRGVTRTDWELLDKGGVRRAPMGIVLEAPAERGVSRETGKPSRASSSSAERLKNLVYCCDSCSSVFDNCHLVLETAALSNFQPGRDWERSASNFRQSLSNVPTLLVYWMCLLDLIKWRGTSTFERVFWDSFFDAVQGSWGFEIGYRVTCRWLE